MALLVQAEGLHVLDLPRLEVGALSVQNQLVHIRLGQELVSGRVTRVQRLEKEALLVAQLFLGLLQVER